MSQRCCRSVSDLCCNICAKKIFASKVGNLVRGNSGRTIRDSPLHLLGRSECREEANVTQAQVFNEELRHNFRVWMTPPFPPAENTFFLSHACIGHCTGHTFPYGRGLEVPFFSNYEASTSIYIYNPPFHSTVSSATEIQK